MRRMMSNDGDDEGCCSNDNAIEDAARVDGSDNGVGVRKIMMLFVCVCVCVREREIACQEK